MLCNALLARSKNTKLSIKIDGKFIQFGMFCYISQAVCYLYQNANKLPITYVITQCIELN